MSHAAAERPRIQRDGAPYPTGKQVRLPWRSTGGRGTGYSPEQAFLVPEASMIGLARHHLLLGAGLVLAACTGNIGEAPVGKSQEAQCGALQPGEAPIRRMTRTEYNNTVRDL